MPESSGSEVTYVTLGFDRKPTAEEVERLKTQTDAIEVLAANGGHHDHDHPKLV
jgi:hypothetical protein